MLKHALQQELEHALAECERLKEENAKLRALLKLQLNDSFLKEVPSLETNNNSIADLQSLSTKEKITLFRSLFCGRNDIYAIRWESKDGRTGYSPAYANKKWNRCQCQKPKARCPICNQLEFLPLTNQVIYDHLKGIQTIGIYPLLKEETCWFLAIDFDKSTWEHDVKAFLKTCNNLSVPAALERSRSGNGAHIWIFFEQPIPAFLARKLGSGILTRTMNEHYQLSLTSYDRLFPNQDTLPKGGFGNLIALPLQGQNRKKGNTVFLTDKFEPHLDQWSFLNSIKRLTIQKTNSLIELLAIDDDTIDICKSLTSEDDTDPWLIKTSKTANFPEITDPLPKIVNITLANLIYIENKQLPAILLNRLKKIAAFQNPEFYKAQSMRLSTHNKPRVIGCAEDFKKHLGLPRGCLSDVLHILKHYKIEVRINNQTFVGETININFNGELRPQQLQAVEELYKHDIGILAATTAFGKTVTAIYMLAKRQTNTLILVHRQQLLEQWRERLCLFLNISPSEVGVIGAGKRKITNKIDIAMLQTLSQTNNTDNLIKNYGHIIIDECHHISAFSFEQVMRQIKARYILGLTATPIRKDGHHPIILMQCGPIRYQASNKINNQHDQLLYRVKPRHTNFNIFLSQEHAGINEIYATLTLDEARNELIFNDILTSLEEKRSPLVLTERTNHLEFFAEKLKKFAKNVIILKGGLGKKQLKQIAEQLRAIPMDEERIILATGRYIGEGFDDARLDTLFLTMPISWHGTLQQYVGRLHRHHDNKKDVLVYDYVDSQVPILLKMYQKRSKKYKAIGYKIE